MREDEDRLTPVVVAGPSRGTLEENSPLPGPWESALADMVVCEVKGIEGVVILGSEVILLVIVELSVVKSIEQTKYRNSNPRNWFYQCLGGCVVMMKWYLKQRCHDAIIICAEPPNRLTIMTSQVNSPR